MRRLEPEKKPVRTVVCDVTCHGGLLAGAWNKNPPAFEVQNQATMLGYSGSGPK